MKIAIAHRTGSFSERWINYCTINHIQYEIIDPKSNTIIQDIKKFDIFLWHWHPAISNEFLYARQLIKSIENLGVQVFPNSDTCWHFDDKVAQKYLLEAINAPLIPTYVFYEKNEAINWLKKTSYPIVFKLRGGAESINVKLVSTIKEGTKLAKIAFGKGFSSLNRIEMFNRRIMLYKQRKANFIDILKSIARIFIPTKFENVAGKQKGYLLFQQFLPNNNSDTRVFIVDNKAFALKRLVRKNDFRASGSNNPIYDHTAIDLSCIKIAFETIQKLKAQCLAFDFIFDEENKPKIVEISYGSPEKFYDKCEGYWNEDLKWHKGHFIIQELILKSLISQINK